MSTNGDKNNLKPELKWNVLRRRTMIQDPWINLEASDCQLPDGTLIAPFYVNYVNDFAVIVAVTENGEVLLEHQYRHGVEEVLLELPAGAIEPGEEPEKGAARELLEETGYRAEHLEFLCKIAPNASSSSNYAWCYLARNVVKVSGQKLDETELLEVLTVPLEKVREMLRDGDFVQAVHVAALYRALDVIGDV